MSLMAVVILLRSAESTESSKVVIDLMAVSLVWACQWVSVDSGWIASESPASVTVDPGGVELNMVVAGRVRRPAPGVALVNLVHQGEAAWAYPGEVPSADREDAPFVYPEEAV